MTSSCFCLIFAVQQDTKLSNVYAESCGFHLLVLRIVLGRETSSHWLRIRTGGVKNSHLRSPSSLPGLQSQSALATGWWHC